jgi:hypothetical protein
MKREYFLSWNNLLENKCPACDKDLSDAYNPPRDVFICKCGFTISNKKFKLLVGHKVEEKIDRELAEEGEEK